MQEPTGINKRHSTNAGIRFTLDLDSHRRPEVWCHLTTLFHYQIQQQ